MADCADIPEVGSWSVATRRTSQTMSNSECHIYIYRARKHDDHHVIPEDITRLIVDSSVTEIPREEFVDLESLVNVDLPKGLLGIRSKAFFHCASLKYIKIPSTCDLLGFDVFSGCYSLVEVNLPKGIKYISAGLFSGCTSLKKIDIPPSVTHIGVRAFRDCQRLSFLDLKEGLRCIDTHAFCDCWNLRSVFVPSTIETIAQCAFVNCNNLISVEFPKEGRSGIDAYAFFRCRKLVNIAVGNITKVRKAALDGYNEVVDNVSDEVFEFVEGDLKKRFSALPIHKLCYYQAYHPTETTLEQVRQVVQSDALNSVAWVDDSGMTPFHILAMSAKPNSYIFLDLLDSCPKDLVSKEDKYSKTPLYYLVRNGSPESTVIIKSIIQAKMSERIKWLGLGQWRTDVLNQIDVIDRDDIQIISTRTRTKKIGLVVLKLAKYEMMEILSLLDQAVWKVKVDQISSTTNDGREKSRKKAKIDRQSARINSGSDIIISNILPFMRKIKSRRSALEYYGLSDLAMILQHPIKYR
jgi:hypothetical protein